MSSDEQAIGKPYGTALPLSGAFDRLARGAVEGALARLTRGHLTVVDGNRRQRFGEERADLAATITVHSPSFYRRIAGGGSIGAGEAYMEGDWSCSDLPALIRIMVRNRHVQAQLEGGAARLAGMVQRLLHRWRDNSRRGSRRNIAAHYDLGNDFYRLFLDPTMAYSCGYFLSPDSTLEEASLAKFDLICAKLGLAPGMSLLEIGTGWGGFALHAARHYGCRVTTTTISRRQYDFTAARLRAAGLDGQVTLLNRDYRDLEGEYDRLVSIEMIEAVGDRHLPAFFAACARHLRPGGRALIQAITMPDQAYPEYLKNPDFINRYIFPGGCCPSRAAIDRAVAAATDLTLEHCEELTAHYVRTLREWRRAFHARLGEVRALGCDERFIRMWDYYLGYCEGGFAEDFIGLKQLVYARPAAAVRR